MNNGAGGDAAIIGSIVNFGEIEMEFTPSVKVEGLALVLELEAVGSHPPFI